MEFQIQSQTAKTLEDSRREFLNAVFSLIKGLAIHAIDNESLRRPKEAFWTHFQILKDSLGGKTEIEIAYEENLLTVMNHKVNKHFSIVEALKTIPEAMEMAMLEKVKFLPHLTEETAGRFFQAWALHCSTSQKPRPFSQEFEGVELVYLDPEKSSSRIKSRNLMMKPSFSLGHYFLLRQATHEIFQGIIEGRVGSQRQIRRELLEILEIGHVNPYQLVALSVIRPQDEQATGLDHAVAEAISNALLSLVLARNLEFSVKDQLNLGVSALFYNVGLLSEELSEIVSANKTLSQWEYKRVIEGHAGGVIQLLKAQGADRPGLERLLALFEATQGSNKKNIALTLESRLLRMVSAYVALTSDRPYREAYTPYEALKLLGSRATSKSEGNLDPVLYYVFVRFMGVFPVGSLVQLSDQRKAVVYRPSGEQLQSPIVKICVDDENEKPLTIDLGLEKNLTIAKSLDPHREGVQISGYFFE